MNPKEQITELNVMVKTRIAPSKIHGVGIFALRDLKKGEKLYSDLYPRAYKLSPEELPALRPEIRALLLERWPNILNGSAFMYPDSRMQAYLNHSEKANYDAQNDILLKNVKQGQEITEDYRKIQGYAQLFPFLTG